MCLKGTIGDALTGVVRTDETSKTIAWRWRGDRTARARASANGGTDTVVDGAIGSAGVERLSRFKC